MEGFYFKSILEFFYFAFFWTAIWLPHGQLCTIIEGLVSVTRCWSLTTFLDIWPEGHWESRNKVGLSPAERLVGFESETFQIWLQHFNPLGHSLHEKIIQNERIKLNNFFWYFIFFIYLIPDKDHLEISASTSQHLGNFPLTKTSAVEFFLSTFAGLPGSFPKGCLNADANADADAEISK